MNPDFSKYTYFELLDALRSIDSEKYPEKVKEINDELVNVVEKMKEVGFRFPFYGIPSEGFLGGGEHRKSFWNKLKSALGFSTDNPIKNYGNIDASISGADHGSYNFTSVAAYMVEDKGNLSLVLRGQFYNTSSEAHEVARIKIDGSNISRLKDLLEVVQTDIEEIKPR